MKWFKHDGYGLPATLAVGLHGAIAIATLVAVDFSEEKKPAPKHPPVVNARVLDVSQTVIGQREAEAERQKQAEQQAQKKKAEAERKRQADAKALAEQKRKLAQAKKEKEEAVRKSQEAKRLADQKAAEQKKREQEQKRLAEKQAADKRKAEQLKQEQAALAKKQEAERQAAAERKREAERQQAEQARREAEIQRAEQAAREAEEQRLAKEAAEKAAEEQRQRQVAEAQMVQSISGLINSRIEAVWSRPANARNGMQTTLRIYFVPTGEVINVEVLKRSGDDLFDQRAVDAVYKVGQIEELADVEPYVFERNFRQVELLFNPTDLRN
ncbi:cell envelope integrity protein TolA [Marinomonas dokdonensis]|uniref:cell envelope integrity protein TolA n=1 Tax=Marinomonas dokdonensis TaxID=328224 RepID=UPI0040557040